MNTSNAGEANCERSERVLYAFTDPSAFWGRYVSSLLLALITGSVFYDMPLNTGGLVRKSKRLAS